MYTRGFGRCRGSRLQRACRQESKLAVAPARPHTRAALPVSAWPLLQGSSRQLRVHARRQGSDVEDEADDDNDDNEEEEEQPASDEDRKTAAGDYDDVGDVDLDALIAEDVASDANLDDILDRIGVSGDMGGSETSQAREEAGVDYPEPPKRKVTFAQLLQKCNYDDEVLEQYKHVKDVEVTGITYDSRELREGEIFVPIVGAHHNAYHFIPDAIEHGASLIIARVMVPGADLGLYSAYNPFDDESPENDLFKSAFYQAADVDEQVMRATATAVDEAVQKGAAFADEHGLSEREAATVCVEQALRSVSSALEYDFSHWQADREDISERDFQLTPHPLNPLIPTECPVPVIFAIDPPDFAATLAAGFYDDPSRRMTTVGVTGTNGKTTVSWLMRSVLEQTGQLTGIIGTVEYALGTDRLTRDGDFWQADEVDTTLKRECSAPFWAAPYEGKYAVDCTTPDNISMQKLMAAMADRGATACTMECSSIGLEQGRVDEVDFDVAIFTNLTQDHLDYHDTMEEYLEAKAALFTGLHDPTRQRAIINLDSQYAQDIADAAAAVPVVTYSVDNEDADVYVESAKFGIFSTNLTVATPLGRIQFGTPLIGRPNVYNMLAVIAASISINIDLKDVVDALANAEIVPGRFELIDEGQDFSVIVDYAHTPDALNALLDTVRECSDARRVILLFGCGGDRDKTKRRYMGEIAHYKADVVILTNDNPRTERPEDIIADIVSGFPEDITDAHPDSVYNYLVDVGRIPQAFEEELLEWQGEVRRHVMEDRFTAIRAAIGMAQKNDVVVIAGKGHEDYIEYCDVNGSTFKGWFDDRVEARNALSKLPYISKVPYLNRKTFPWTRRR